jgi:hypothetical protein
VSSKNASESKSTRMIEERKFSVHTGQCNHSSAFFLLSALLCSALHVFQINHDDMNLYSTAEMWNVAQPGRGECGQEDMRGSRGACLSGSMGHNDEKSARGVIESQRGMKEEQKGIN